RDCSPFQCVCTHQVLRCVPQNAVTQLHASFEMLLHQRVICEEKIRIDARSPPLNEIAEVAPCILLIGTKQEHRSGNNDLVAPWEGGDGSIIFSPRLV